MLNQWLKGRNPRPTLGALAEALKSSSVNMAHLAQQLPTIKESELYSYTATCIAATATSRDYVVIVFYSVESARRTVTEQLTPKCVII